MAGVSGALGFFPAVGLLLGLALVGLDEGLSAGLPRSIVSGLLVVGLVVMTGAIHVDGFIDTCDGLAGGRTAEQRWEIMRDSRVGAYGVVGGVSILLVKYLCLAGLPSALRWEALLLAPALGRWGVTWCVLLFRYARPEGLGRAFKESAGWAGVALGTGLTLAAALVFLETMGLVVMFGTGAVALGTAALLQSRFAGLTGDNYGAIIEVGEIAALLLIIALPGWGW